MADRKERRGWSYGSRTGMVFGLALYALEALQSIALIPFFKLMLGANEASYWVAITTSVGLVALAYAGYYQPLVRNVSMTRGDHAAGELPANWEAVNRRVALIGRLLLIGSQLVFVGLVLGSRTGNQHGLWPALVYFAAMHLRLEAFNHFVLLNGLHQVGRDKLLLIIASAVNLALMLLLGSVFKNALALAAASVVANGVLFVLARAATASSIRSTPRSALSVAVPGRREVFGLLLLSLAGYLNLSTDIVLSARLLPAEEALDYAFWSRLLFTQVAVVSLAVQVRFPFWASLSRPFSTILLEVRKAYWLLLLSAGVMLAAFVSHADAEFLHRGSPLALWMFAAMGLNAYLASLTTLLGQALTVRNCYTFMRPSIVVACCAPVAAVMFAQWVSPQSFVFGYLLANLCLFAVVFKCSREHLHDR